jgi:hypothetical protein
MLYDVGLLVQQYIAWVAFVTIDLFVFILNKGKKDIVFQMGQKYLTITSSLKKHQTTTMLLFKLAVFLLLSGRSAATNSLPEAYSLPKRSSPLWGSS